MRYLICLTLLVSMPLQAGAIKKWVDESGKTHYGGEAQYLGEKE